jgi:uncharacterized protein YecT (DUF1311 family)
MLAPLKPRITVTNYHILFLRSSAPQAIIDITSLTCDGENSTNVGGTTNSSITVNGGCNNKHTSCQHKGGHYKECTSTVLSATSREEIGIFKKRQNAWISIRKKNISPRKYESLQLTGSQSFSPSQQTAFLHTHYWQSARRQWTPEKQLGHAWQQVMPQPSALVH